MDSCLWYTIKSFLSTGNVKINFAHNYETYKSLERFFLHDYDRFICTNICNNKSFDNFVVFNIPIDNAIFLQKYKKKLNQI